jgi:hypothetical protein
MQASRGGSTSSVRKYESPALVMRPNLINTMQREDALGEVDTNKQNSHGHPLPSGEHVRFRTPIVAPSSDVAFGSIRRASGWNEDVPFIR